jgi:hypothetical protein
MNNQLWQAFGLLYRSAAFGRFGIGIFIEELKPILLRCAHPAPKQNSDPNLHKPGADEALLLYI